MTRNSKTTLYHIPSSTVYLYKNIYITDIFVCITLHIVPDPLNSHQWKLKSLNKNFEETQPLSKKNLKTEQRDVKLLKYIAV